MRFSPAGDRLVTGADGGDIFVWRPAPHEHAETLGGEDAVAGDPAHCWKPVKMERAVGSDVMDVAWSPDGTAGEASPWAGRGTGTVPSPALGTNRARSRSRGRVH